MLLCPCIYENKLNTIVSTGSVDGPSLTDAGETIYYHGRKILHNGFAYLNEFYLKGATKVVLVGESAGGLSVITSLACLLRIWSGSNMLWVAEP